MDIKEIRKSLKMNQQEFGELLGYSSNSASARQSIHWIEKGIKNLPASKRKIIELLLENKEIIKENSDLKINKEKIKSLADIL